MSTRAENEKKFGHWEELPGGGRRYRLDVPGRLDWLARYLKEVDANETTLRFWQEVYHDQSKLVEISREIRPWIKATRKVSDADMTITKQTVADKIAAYLHHQISRFFAVFGGIGLSRLRGHDTGKTVSRFIGAGVELGSVREPIRAGEQDGLFGDPRDATAVGIGALPQGHGPGLLLRPHGRAHLAPPQCLPAPLRDHLPAAAWQARPRVFRVRPPWKG
jgi:hypothetical protein